MAMMNDPTTPFRLNVDKIEDLLTLPLPVWTCPSDNEAVNKSLPTTIVSARPGSCRRGKTTYSRKLIRRTQEDDEAWDTELRLPSITYSC